MRLTPLAVLLAALLTPAPALADATLVLRDDGSVQVRQDRFAVPTDPVPGAESRGPGAVTAKRPTRRAQPRRAVAAATKRPTPRAELRRLVADGALDPTAADGYRDAYDLARKTLRKLAGVRRVELRAVLANVDALAAGGRFVPSRLPALFQTLQRNRAWWQAAPLPRTGQRVGFQGSRLVWQYYPGQGLQIQWLGTFGKANALFASGGHDPELRELLDETLELATQRAGGIAWEYLLRFGGGAPPWVSGLAQGTALSALSRAAVRLGEPRYFDQARAALGIFRTPPPQGVRSDTPVGAHFLQYSFAPKLLIANGFVQALNGLNDFATLANDDEGRALFAAGETQLRAELPGYDTGAWSLYSSAGRESDLGYHTLLRDFLRGLCGRLGKRPGTADPALYCETADRFTADLTTPPTVTIEPTTLRAKRGGAVRFTVSKVGTVAVTVSRRGRVELATGAVRFGRGRHDVLFRPKAAGPRTVVVRAVDLAGNATTLNGALHVRPARRRPPKQDDTVAAAYDGPAVPASPHRR